MSDFKSKFPPVDKKLMAWANETSKHEDGCAALIYNQARSNQKAKAEIERLEGELKQERADYREASQNWHKCKAQLDAVRGLPDKWRGTIDWRDMHPINVFLDCATELEAIINPPKSDKRP